MSEVTQEEYIAAEGLLCPNCRSREVEATTYANTSSDPHILYQNVACGDCGASWTDEYRLAGYDHLMLEYE